MPLYSPSRGTSAPVQVDLPAIASWVALFEAKRLPVVADGTALSTWTDSSGNSRHATQTAGARPTYKGAPNGINNQPVVRFTRSSSQYMVTATGGASLGTNFYVAAVLRLTSNGNENQFPICFGNEATGQRRGLIKYDFNNKFGFNALKSAVPSGGTAPVAGDVHFVEMTGAGNSIALYIDGVLAVTDTDALSAFSSTALRIGANNGGTENLNGDIALAVFLGSVPNKALLTKIRTYVALTYGIAFTGAPGSNYFAKYSAAGLATLSSFYDDGTVLGVFGRQLSLTGFGDNHLLVLDPDATLGATNANVCAWQHKATNGAAATRFLRGADGYEMGAIGWREVGNDSFYLAGKVYLSSSVYNTGGVPQSAASPAIVLGQETNAGVFRRLEIEETTGDIVFYRRDTTFPGETKILTIKETGRVILNTAVLPTSDPSVAGEIYSLGAPSTGLPKALMVSGG